MEDTAQKFIEQLKERVTLAKLPPDIEEKLLNQLKYLTFSQFNGSEFEKLISYIEFATLLPFGKLAEDILDLQRAKEILDKNHFGLQNVKNRILEYLAVLILNKRKGSSISHAPILSFIGLVGTGKTSLASSIAESLGRPFIRIPFGGLGEAASLRGTSKVRDDAEPGQIIKAIQISKVSNPVILLDEIDRVGEGGRAEIMGVLIELLDPEQNHAFWDHYLDFPYDLSQVLFITTANNTTNIATAVADRLELIQMPSYSDEEKQTIGKNYLLPQAMSESGIDQNIITFDDNLWPSLIRPLGYDGGIRSLQRNIQSICRKIARKVVEGETGPFKISSENLREYLGGQS